MASVSSVDCPSKGIEGSMSQQSSKQFEEVEVREKEHAEAVTTASVAHATGDISTTKPQQEETFRRSKSNDSLLATVVTPSGATPNESSPTLLASSPSPHNTNRAAHKHASSLTLDGSASLPNKNAVTLSLSLTSLLRGNPVSTCNTTPLHKEPTDLGYGNDRPSSVASKRLSALCTTSPTAELAKTGRSSSGPGSSTSQQSSSPIPQPPASPFPHPLHEPPPMSKSRIPFSTSDHSLNLPWINGPVAHNSAPGGNRGRLRLPAEDNVPDRFESFILDEGEKKVVEKVDESITSTSMFTFNKEDHTLANMLRSRLLQNPHVLFAGYKVPHPLFNTFMLRVQTDGSLTPRAAVVQASRDLVNDLGTLSREFTKEYELRKMAGDGAGAEK